jgi:hypothetical protein
MAEIEPERYVMWRMKDEEYYHVVTGSIESCSAVFDLISKLDPLSVFDAPIERLAYEQDFLIK